MFKNVLVGVDGRPGGQDAVALATRLTDNDGVLTLAHVCSADLRLSRAIAPGLLAEEREGSEKLLADERAAANVEAKLVTVVGGDAGRGLHDQAEAQGADLLVVGSCRRGVLGRAMLGDDTRTALNGASCAVAIASDGYAAEHPARFAKIGVAYNGSPESVVALTVARELARINGASVRALEVVSIPSVAYAGAMPPALGDSVDVMLQEATSRMAALPNVVGRAVYGFPGEELAAFGEGLDLLIGGSRSYGAVKRLMLPSTTEYLAHKARCPLLVLPHAASGRAVDEGSTPALVGAGA